MLGVAIEKRKLFHLHLQPARINRQGAPALLTSSLYLTLHAALPAALQAAVQAAFKPVLAKYRITAKDVGTFGATQEKELGDCSKAERAAEPIALVAAPKVGWRRP